MLNNFSLSMDPSYSLFISVFSLATPLVYTLKILPSFTVSIDWRSANKSIRGLGSLKLR